MASRTLSPADHNRPTAAFAGLAAAIAMCAVGIWLLARHASDVGAAGAAPVSLPAALAAALDWHHDQPLLVLAAHPQCPCLDSTLDELERVLAAADAVTVRTLVFAPTHRPEAWCDEDDVRLAPCGRNGAVLPDRDGWLAARLGCLTSGHVLVYDPAGALRFSGGVTGSRGHRGDNPGARALAAALAAADSAPVAHPPVYGCPIHNAGYQRTTQRTPATR